MLSICGTCPRLRQTMLSARVGLGARVRRRLWSPTVPRRAHTISITSKRHRRWSMVLSNPPPSISRTEIWWKLIYTRCGWQNPVKSWRPIFRASLICEARDSHSALTFVTASLRLISRNVLVQGCGRSSRGSRVYWLFPDRLGPKTRIASSTESPLQRRPISLHHSIAGANSMQELALNCWKPIGSQSFLDFLRVNVGRLELNRRRPMNSLDYWSGVLHRAARTSTHTAIWQQKDSCLDTTSRGFRSTRLFRQLASAVRRRHICSGHGFLQFRSSVHAA